MEKPKMTIETLLFKIERGLNWAEEQEKEKEQKHRWKKTGIQEAKRIIENYINRYKEENK